MVEVFSNTPPWAQLVEGRLLPVQLADHVALELCNTLAGWTDGDVAAAGDYLRDHETACVWAGHTGLLDAALTDAAIQAGKQDALEARAELDRLRAFRSALWHTLVDPTPHDHLTVALEIEQAARSLTFEVDGPGRFLFPPECGVALPRLAAAWSASQLLTSPDRRQVRACPGRQCGWLFLDRSGRRRWCLMASCGNREKARRHAARRRQHTDAASG